MNMMGSLKPIATRRIAKSTPEISPRSISITTHADSDVAAAMRNSSADAYKHQGYRLKSSRIVYDDRDHVRLDWQGNRPGWVVVGLTLLVILAARRPYCLRGEPGGYHSALSGVLSLRAKDLLGGVSSSRTTILAHGPALRFAVPRLQSSNDKNAARERRHQGGSSC
jgi:hypothetical protein